jgi:branched-chain amino acid transport system permease protein
LSQGFVARHVEAIVIAAVVCAAILFGATGQFAATTAAFLMVWVLMAQGWNIISGFGGPLALGQAAYFGIADFVTLLLLDRYGVTQYVGILVGVAAALLIAFVVGGITLQKPAFFFAITSLLVPLILQAIIIYFGIFQIPRRLPPEPSLAMFWFADAFPYLVAGGLLVVITGFFTSSMRLRRMGRFLVANRENTRPRARACPPIATS